MAGSFLFLSIVLYRRLEGYNLRYLVTGVMKISAAVLVMALWLLWLRHFLDGAATLPLAARAGRLLLLIASGALVYGVAIYFFKLEEFTSVVGKVRQRIFQ